ncbi:MAG: ATP-dependent endonuclease [Desulfobulbaceae bacterium]|nr:ATP-dependent endonuclease [Desulfobulbaceae bacterium]HIJ90090.1 AAA family ATPase [Deltaproteobacteria bacterium]
MKLKKLIIKNFGCFGDTGQSVDIDDIVVLIGPNNVGKSTVLDAYEAYVSVGVALQLESFHKEKAENAVELSGVFIEINDDDKDTIGTKYIHEDPEVGECIKVKWQWETPGLKGEKYSWNEPEGKWDKGGVGGWDTLIASRLPTPLRISPVDTPEKLEATIATILTASIKKSLKKDTSLVSEIVTKLQELTNELGKEVETEIAKTCQTISESLAKIFPGSEVNLVPEYGKFEPEKTLGAGSHVRIKTPVSDLIPLSCQGSGIQRAFLWSAISALAGEGRLKQGTKKISTDKGCILLIDEPESFLHPPLVRAARDSLYAIAEIEGWQVMASTHSPILIDVSKPHTTIVRVNNFSGGGANVFSTDQETFGEEERTRLRMIRSCHPSVNEFFFADKIILVEGETEHALLNELFADMQGSIHVVNCMGKGNIPMFAKILNQFQLPYIVFHDSDCPKIQRKDKWIKSGMWTMNKTIRDSVPTGTVGGSSCSTIVHVPDFEGYYFNTNLSGDKPFQALTHLF